MRRSGKRTIIRAPAARATPPPAPIPNDPAREKEFRRIRLIDSTEKEIIAKYDAIIAEVERRKSEFASSKSMQELLYKERAMQTRLRYENEQMRHSLEDLRKQVDTLTTRLKGIRDFMTNS